MPGRGFNDRPFGKSSKLSFFGNSTDPKGDDAQSGGIPTDLKGKRWDLSPGETAKVSQLPSNLSTQDCVAGQWKGNLFGKRLCC